MFGTTRGFLDYFNLKTLDELPTLAELRDLESVNPELDLPPPDDVAAPAANEPETQELPRPGGLETPGPEGEAESTRH
jgi:segregation and condensation protein B